MEALSLQHEVAKHSAESLVQVFGGKDLFGRDIRVACHAVLRGGRPAHPFVIVRQTEDLRRIVDEFSKFARMPQPQRRPVDLSKVLRDAVVLQDVGQVGVTFNSSIPDHAVMSLLDETMISQALINLIKNAGEAIESLKEKKPPENLDPQIMVRMTITEDAVQLTIADNGIGLPEDRAALFEPYVTTRDEGTGLGLPIVKKIIEEHGGSLSLEDAEPMGGNPHSGASAIVTLPILSMKNQIK